MNISRRGFLQAILATGVAPAFVRAENLMPVKELIVPSQEIITDLAGIEEYKLTWEKRGEPQRYIGTVERVAKDKVYDPAVAEAINKITSVPFKVKGLEFGDRVVMVDAQTNEIIVNELCKNGQVLVNVAWNGDRPVRTIVRNEDVSKEIGFQPREGRTVLGSSGLTTSMSGARILDEAPRPGRVHRPGDDFDGIIEV